MKSSLIVGIGMVVSAALSLSAATITSRSPVDTETVYLTTNGVPVMSGWTLPEGTVVKLRTQGDQRFLRWVGAVPEGVDATSREIEVTLGPEDLLITPLYEGMWRLANLALTSSNARTGTIYSTSTAWAINVKVSNAETHTLAAGVNPATDFVSGTKGELDLSTPIVGDDGACWQIVTFGSKIFSQYPSAYSITRLVMPRTLARSNQGLNDAARVTVVIHDCPNFTDRLAGWSMTGGNANLVLKSPRIPRIEKDWAYGLSQTDVSEWDLSGVKTLDASCMAGKSFFGTLRLPSAQTVDNRAFYGTTKLAALELGMNLTLKSVGTNVVTGSGITRLTLGGALTGWTIQTNSFTLANGLSQVEFLSIPPTLAAEGTFAHETDVTPLSVCFYIPRDRQLAWRSVRGEILRRATEADLAAFRAANPNAVDPEFVISRAAFGTKYEQLLGHTKLAHQVTCTVGDRRFGSHVTVSPEKPYGYYMPGDEITLTAHPGEGTTFTRWTGLPREVTNFTDSTVTFRVGDRPLKITMWAGPTWIYVAADHQITNAVWKLNAFEVSDGQLRIGSSDYYSAYTGFGEGVLDMSGKVYDAQDPGREWVITRFGSAAFHSRAKSDSANPNCWVEVMTGLVIPRTLQATSSQWLNCNAGDSKMKTLVFDSPDFKGELAGYAIQRWGCPNVVFDAPGLTAFGGENAITCEATDSPIDAWNLRGVKTIRQKSLSGSLSRGTLHLESLKTAETTALSGKAVTGYEFGTGYDIKGAPKLTLGASAVAKNSHLESIKFGPYADIKVDETTFAECPVLRKIEFEGRPVATNVLNSLLRSASVLTEQVEPVVVYASAALGWNKIEGLVSLQELSAEEQARVPDVLDEPTAVVMGAFRCADGVKRAWVVSCRSRFDPKGTLLFIR